MALVSVQPAAGPSAALPTGTVTNIRKSATWSMSGTRARARFGSALAVGVGGHCLAVGSPYADGDGDDLAMAGAVDMVHPF